MSTYITSSTYTGTPNATIHLRGLLCLCFDGLTKCTIGVNHAGGGHNWQFLIVEQGATTNEEILNLTQKDSTVREIYINITNGAVGGSYVFTGTTSERSNLENSWIDLEGARGHNRRIKNDLNTLWPRFYINDGLFCASRLSTESFALQDNKTTPLKKPLGPVALEMVADIFLKTSPTPKIEIKLLDGTEVKTVPLDSSKRYRIDIINDCAGASDSDFPLHYKSFSAAFDGSPGKMTVADQFTLITDPGAESRQSELILAQAGDDFNFFESTSNRAPCMGIALGLTTKFN